MWVALICVVLVSERARAKRGRWVICGPTVIVIIIMRLSLRSDVSKMKRQICNNNNINTNDRIFGAILNGLQNRPAAIIIRFQLLEKWSRNSSA